MADNVRYKQQIVDYLGFLQSKLRDLRGIATLAYELIQNADDVLDENGRPAATRITFDVCDDALIVENDGVFLERDFERMAKIASGGKREEAGTTGAFGIGFISVYQVTDSPEILSGGRHWRIRPEAGGCIEEYDVQTQYTRFRLPWAFDPTSEVRRKLRIEAVRVGQLPTFEQEIGQAISLAALFLKQLTVLELKRSGKSVKRIERVIGEDDQVLISDDSNQDCFWRIFRDSFEGQAAVLRGQYSLQIEDKRYSNVMIAIPDGPLKTGRLFAVLPSEISIPLPFHINADFFTTSDRKHLIWGDDYQAEWNRAAIRAAAQALAAGFDKLPDLLRHEGLWALLEKLVECKRQAEEREIDAVFAAFWDKVAPNLPTRPIVFTTKGQWIIPGKVRLLQSEVELAATSIFKSLSIPIVHPDLRPYFGLMRQKEIGILLLSVPDVAQAMNQAGLGERVPLSQAPPALGRLEDWHILWRALDELLERCSLHEREQAVDTLRACAIAPGVDGALWPPFDIFRGDADTQSLFPSVHWLSENVPSDTIPGNLVADFTAQEAIELLSAYPTENLESAWHNGALDIEAVYRWFESRKSEILPDPPLVGRIRVLSVWPASGHLYPLSELYIPGGFDDPLKLSTLVDLSVLGGRKEFLRELGVAELTFETYVRERVPRVLAENPDLDLKTRRQLVQLLATRLGEMRDDGHLQDRFGSLPLIECKDGEFRPARQVYLQREVIDILGHDVYVAVPSTEAVKALYEWLGVAQRPRPADVIKRLRELVAKPPDDAAQESIQTIFGYLANEWSKWSEGEQQQYTPLQNMAWLPGTGDGTRWYRPGELYAVFQSYLFDTQAVFLKISRQLQTLAAAVGLIKFLDIETSPSPVLVVRHLKFCSERGEQVNKEVYRFLNDNANDPAINQLKDTPCLLLPDGQYVHPKQVFWSEHPFGPFRYQLGSDLRLYSALFGKLGVREHPEDHDFIQVLIEISDQYGQRNAPLDDQASYTVVMNCWAELSTALEAGRLDAQNLDELQGHKVVPDPRKLLAKPENIFFEDRPGLAAKFPEFLENSVIPRPQGAWRAMEAVGVRPLSQAVQVHVVECDDPTDDAALMERLKQRRPLIERVAESDKASGASNVDVAALDSLQIQQARQLIIQYTLQAFRQTRTTEAEPVPAFFNSKEYTLFAVHQNGSVPWAAVAREVGYAIKPIGEVGGLAGGIREALAGNSFEEASRTLDELGYPPVQQRPDQDVTGASVIGALGGTEPTAEDAVTAILGGQGGDRTPMPVAPPETPPGDGATGSSERGDGRPGGRGRAPHKPQGKLRTYLVPGDRDGGQGDVDTDGTAHRSKVDQAGITHVLDFERDCRRMPTEKDHYHKGYDIESLDEAGSKRYIEVKSLSGDWGTRNAAGLTKPQFDAARELGDQFWLYVVERATSENFQIYCIQNPANRVNQYLFDDGWQVLAE